MGISSSSLLDESTSNFIRGRVEAELKTFGPLYRKQYSVAFLSQVQDELEQRKEERTQLLKQRDPPQPSEVVYEEQALYFDDSRKWRERFIVVRANYSLECHESYETFVRGGAAQQTLLPTGGTIWTTEEKYMVMVEKCFPDSSNVPEDFAPPVAGMPGQFPVYLRLPYRRDCYFCFRQEDRQQEFISILSDCIRHQNQDFLKKQTCEVKAFLKAIQLYRQQRGLYEPWDMLIGSDVRVMANLLMADLVPRLEKDMLPRLKAKKTERKRVWFATVEAAYILVQSSLLNGLSALKAECKVTAQQQGALMRSDMDQILSSRAFLEGKLRAKVTEPAENYCTEHVQPHLPAVLEEVMGPISLGFNEARELSEGMMDQLCQEVQKDDSPDNLKQALQKMSMVNLQECYKKVGSIKDHMQELQQSFSYPNITGLEHSTQIDIQQLVKNAAYTFELLLMKTLDDNPAGTAMAMERAKQRVLKQYDYDSSTVRQRIFQEALVGITVPSIKQHLAPSFREELPKYEQHIDADYADFINVENVYEDILLQTLENEVSKVVKEAASLHKYNLFLESRDRFSQSSLYSSTSGSSPGSPTRTGTSPSLRQPQPASPRLGGTGWQGLIGTDGVFQEEPEKAVVEQAKAVETQVMEVTQPAEAMVQEAVETPAVADVTPPAVAEVTPTVQTVVATVVVEEAPLAEEEVTPTAEMAVKEAVQMDVSPPAHEEVTPLAEATELELPTAGETVVSPAGEAELKDVTVAVESEVSKAEDAEQTQTAVNEKTEGIEAEVTQAAEVVTSPTADAEVREETVATEVNTAAESEVSITEQTGEVRAQGSVPEAQALGADTPAAAPVQTGVETLETSVGEAQNNSASSEASSLSPPVTEEITQTASLPVSETTTETSTAEIVTEDTPNESGPVTIKTSITMETEAEIPSAATKTETVLSSDSVALEAETQPASETVTTEKTDAVVMAPENTTLASSPSQSLSVEVTTPSAGETEESGSPAEASVPAQDPHPASPEPDAVSDGGSWETEEEDAESGIEEDDSRTEATESAELQLETEEDNGSESEQVSGDSVEVQSTSSQAESPQPTETASEAQASADAGARIGAPTPTEPYAQPPDSVKEIRDLVMEVIEVEEMIQHYPDNNGA